MGSHILALQATEQDYENAIETATKHGLNMLAIADPRVTMLDSLCTYVDIPDYAKTGGALAQTVTRVEALNRIVNTAQNHGIDAYIQYAQVFGFPPKFINSHQKGVDLDDQETWNLLSAQLSEVSTSIPNLKGFILLFSEAKNPFWTLAMSKPLEDYFLRAFHTALEVARKYGKNIIADAFFNPPRQHEEAFVRALQMMPRSDDFLVWSQHTWGDWGALIPNLSLSDANPHPVILAFDTCGEVWGQGTIPLCQVDFMKEEYLEALHRGANIAGLAGTFDWWETKRGITIAGTPNEVNLAAMRRLIENPNIDPKQIYDEWTINQYGQGTEKYLTPALRRSFEVVLKSRQVLSVWALEWPKSYLAPPDWINFSLDYHSPKNYDPSPLNKKLHGLVNGPTEDSLKEILAEKEEAIKLSEGALNLVEQAKNFLKPEDYDLLHGQFLMERDESNLLKPYFEVFFRLKILKERNDKNQLPSMKTLIQELTSWEEYFKKHYTFDPWNHAQKIHEYISRIKELMSSQPFKKILPGPNW